MAIASDNNNYRKELRENPFNLLPRRMPLLTASSKVRPSWRSGATAISNFVRRESSLHCRVAPFTLGFFWKVCLRTKCGVKVMSKTDRWCPECNTGQRAVLSATRHRFHYLSVGEVDRRASRRISVQPVACSAITRLLFARSCHPPRRRPARRSTQEPASVTIRA
jgi:hypothetical protein